MMIAAVSKLGATSANGAALPEKTTMAEITTPITLSPTINPEASRTPTCFVASGRGDKTVGVIYQIEHGRNHKCSGDDANHEGDLLFPRRCVDQLGGLQILQVVVRDSGDVENDRGREKRERHQRFAGLRPNVRFYAEHEQQRRADHYENANARERTVG